MKHIQPEKETMLLEALIDRKGMQEIVDKAAAAFENPVFVCDLGCKIICYSDHDADLDGFWEQMKQNSYSIPEQISQIMRTGDFARIYATDMPRIGQYPFAESQFLAARIRDGSKPMGHVCVYGCRRAFREEDLELLILLCKILSYEMLYRGLSAPLKIPYFSLLSDLLEGRIAEKTELTMRLQCMKLSLPVQPFLAVIDFKDPMVQAVASYIREYLLQKLPDSLGIVYKNQLLLLISKKTLDQHGLEQNLASYEDNLDYRIGVSNPVTDLMKLKVNYEQALNSIRIGALLKLPERLCSYRRLYVYQILLYAGKETKLEYLCDPAVLDMYDYDRQHHTEYLKDLELYLSCGKNINKTAKLACVHKNSMYYRISKLEEKFSLSLSDEETCFSLQLSLKILKLMNR